jgi:hypothetical protein
VQVVYGHLDDPEGQDIKRGVSYLKLRPGGWEGRPLGSTAGTWRLPEMVHGHVPVHKQQQLGLQLCSRHLLLPRESR